MARKCPYSQAELGQMLRNYRLRRRLGLLPKSGATEEADDEEGAARWLRQTWRPLRLAAPSRKGGPSGATADCWAEGAGGDDEEDETNTRVAELLNRIGELQLRVERGYSELNATRRAQHADSEGLRRQGDSCAAIAAECASLREQLVEAKKEVQDRSAENGGLSVQLGLRRASVASSLTQAALLASAVRKIGSGGASAITAAVRAPLAVPQPSPSLQELEACRLHITALVEENEELRRAAERRRGVPAAASGSQPLDVQQPGMQQPLVQLQPQLQRLQLGLQQPVGLLEQQRRQQLQQQPAQRDIGIAAASSSSGRVLLDPPTS